MKQLFVRVMLKLVPQLFWNKDYSPNRCPVCGHKKFNSKIRSVDGGFVSEEDIYCAACNSFVQEFAYGYYNQYNTKSEPWKHILGRYK